MNYKNLKATGVLYRPNNKNRQAKIFSWSFPWYTLENSSCCMYPREDSLISKIPSFCEWGTRAREENSSKGPINYRKGMMKLIIIRVGGREKTAKDKTGVVPRHSISETKLVTITSYRRRWISSLTVGVAMWDFDEPQSSEENWQQDYSMTVRIYKAKTVKLYPK